jgi:hypothetical protein
MREPSQPQDCTPPPPGGATGRLGVAGVALASSALAWGLLVGVGSAAAARAAPTLVLALGAVGALVVFPGAALGRRRGPLAPLVREAAAFAVAPLPALAACTRAAALPAGAVALGLGATAALALTSLALLRSRRLGDISVLLILTVGLLGPAATAGARALLGDGTASPALWGPAGWGGAALSLGMESAPPPAAAPPPAPARDVRLVSTASPTAGAWRPGLPLLWSAQVSRDGGAPTVLSSLRSGAFYATEVPGGPLTRHAVSVHALAFDAPPRWETTTEAGGPSVGGAASPVAWRLVGPRERLELTADAGADAPLLSTRDGVLRVTTANPPHTLGALRIFDAIGGELDPDLIAAHAALAPWLRGGRRERTSTVEPGLYRVVAPTGLSGPLRRRWAVLSSAGAAAVLLLLLLGGRRMGLTMAVAAAAGGGALVWVSAPAAAVVVTEQTALRLLPGARVAAAEHLVQLETPVRSAPARVHLPETGGLLEPVIFRRGLADGVTIVEARSGAGEQAGSRTEGLILPRGGRQLLRAFAPEHLAGPLEVLTAPDGGRHVLNRTGLSFTHAALYTRRGSVALGELRDGDALALPKEFPGAHALDALPMEVSPWVTHLLRDAAGPLRDGVVALVGPARGGPATADTPAVDRPLVVLMPLGAR